MFTIAKTFHFSAAHRLTRVPEGHKCRRMHGHNYTVEVRLSATDVHATGMVVDYADLTALGHYLDTQVDHRLLNDVLEVEPTAENIAWHFYTWCHRRWPQVTSVRVHETPQTWAEYRP